jgi:dTDP-4-amino-4,6-dideoxygalactose transaminase
MADAPARPIPILDLGRQIETHWTALNDAFQRVLRSGHFVNGQEVQALEAECAQYLGARCAVGLNSGTDALFLALRALGIGPGDEVITTPFTFFATAEAISHVGATPVFADVEPDSFNLDPEAVEQALTPRTRAILPVHLFGRPANMDRILQAAGRNGCMVVEDCAQSFGADAMGKKTGSLGVCGCFSFYPTKNLSAFGDGGMVITDSEGLAEEIRRLRAHGSRKKYYNETVGYNSRLDELQAALLRVKLPHLDGWNQARRDAANRYRELLCNVPGIETPEVVDGHVFHQYTVRVKSMDRDVFQARLKEAGIGSMVYYPVPCHRLKLYAESHKDVRCPVAEAAAREVLSLPIWPELEAETQVRICRTMARILG